ncbi:MAG: hypothetical protein U0572_00270 [Phycisphaerales bacterium]
MPHLAHHRGLVFAMVVAIAVAFGAIPSFGQGTSPYLPEPISTIRLHRLLDDALPPADPRWKGIEEAHDGYLRNARPLLDRRTIEGCLECKGFAGVPSSRGLDAVRAYVAALRGADDALWAKIVAVLGDSPEAHGSFESAKKRRVADRLRDTLASAGGLGSVGEAARRCVVDPEHRRIVNDRLRAYDAEVGELLRKLVEHSLQMIDDGSRAVRDAHLPDPDPADPEAAKAWWTTYQQGSQARMAKLREVREALATLDRDTLRALTKDLPYQVARHVRYAASRASRRLDDYGEGWLEVFFQLVLRSPQLSAEDKAAAANEFEKWGREDDRLVEAIEALGTNAGADERQVAIDACRAFNRDTTRRFMNDQTPWSKAVRERWLSIVNARSPSEYDAFDEDFLFESPDQRPYDHDARWLPPPIAATRIDALADRLGLDHDRRVIALTLLTDHRARWSEGMREVAEKARAAEAAAQTATNADPNGVAPVPAQIVDELVRASMEVFVRAAELDDALYQELRAALGGVLTDDGRAEIALSQLSRELECLGTGDWAMYVNYDAIVRPVDPVAVVDSLTLGGDVRAVVRTALLDRRDAMLAAARDRARAHAAREITSAADELLQRRLAADRAVRRLFDECIAPLDESQRRLAAERYERRAVPEYFADARAPWSLFDRALACGDLTPETRAAIEGLRERTLAAYRAIAGTFADERRSALPIDPPQADARGAPASRQRVAHQTRWLHQRAIVFDRDEVSARAVSELRRLLSDPQRAAVRGLDDYERRVETVAERFIRFAE